VANAGIAGIANLAAPDVALDPGERERLDGIERLGEIVA
jgi:hypothetical protein